MSGASSGQLLWEKPYASAVSANYFERICHGCFKFEETLQLCSRCNTTPYCSDECEEEDWDTGQHCRECSLYSMVPEPQFEIIKGLRSARFHSRFVARHCRDAGIGADDDVSSFPFGTTKWRNIADLMSHSDKLSPEAQEELREMYRKFSPYFSHIGEEDFIQTYGQLQTNSFGVTKYGVYGERELLGCALYLQSSRMNHSCSPDIRVGFVEGNRLVMKPRNADVEKRMKKTALDHFTICYAANMCTELTRNRQKNMEEEKYFTCECVMCKDVNLDLEKRRSLAELCPNCNKISDITTTVSPQKDEQDIASQIVDINENIGTNSNLKWLQTLVQNNENQAVCFKCKFSRQLSKEEVDRVSGMKKEVEKFREILVGDGEGKTWKEWGEFVENQMCKVWDGLRYFYIIRMREALTDTIWEEWEMHIPKSKKGVKIFLDQGKKLVESYVYYDVFTSEYPALLARMAFVYKDQGDIATARSLYEKAKLLWADVVDGASQNVVHDLQTIIDFLEE